MSNLHGNTAGLKKAQLRKLDRLARRKVARDELATWEVVKSMTSISREIRRQVGLIIDRKGKIASIIVGEHRSLTLPKLEWRTALTRLAGYRLVHTHLDEEGLNRQDLTQLTMKRLDLVASIGADRSGFPGPVHVAHIVPANGSGSSTTTIKPTPYPDLELEVDVFIEALEDELSRNAKLGATTLPENRAILCTLIEPDTKTSDADLEETSELARSVGLTIAATIKQKREKPDPKFLVGRGKLEEIGLRATQVGVDTLLFQQNLTPGQARHLADSTGLRILDRTQLILDIFSQRAKSHDGKLQVELAQLRYTYPRLREFNTQMSRLVGGIGGRGPGETKLEIHRRRAKDRISRLEHDISRIARERSTKRSLRKKKNVPTVSIVGYTNAGKSTLLNSLTFATALAENKPFATLDPFSKRLRFPEDRELILTDTVGFIRDLPPDLIAAFRATLEEIGEANLLLHVVDISRSDYHEQLEVVNGILDNLGYGQIPQIVVCNKSDRLTESVAHRIASSITGIAISAQNAATCKPLLTLLEAQLWKQRKEATFATEAVSTY